MLKVVSRNDCKTYIDHQRCRTMCLPTEPNGDLRAINTTSSIPKACIVRSFIPDISVYFTFPPDDPSSCELAFLQIQELWRWTEEPVDSLRSNRPHRLCNYKAGPSMRSGLQLHHGWTDTLRWTPARCWSSSSPWEPVSRESLGCKGPQPPNNKSGGLGMQILCMVWSNSTGIDG